MLVCLDESGRASGSIHEDAGEGFGYRDGAACNTPVVFVRERLHTAQKVRMATQFPLPPATSVLKSRCASRRVLDLVADKWTALVIHCLSQGTRRSNELMRTIEGISQKALTQTLRRLEGDGLVTRKVFPVVPPRVDYALTPLGRSLIKPLCALCRWAEQHGAELNAIDAPRPAAARKQPPSTVRGRA